MCCRADGRARRVWFLTLVLSSLPPAYATADQTSLLRVDLKTGRRQRIDSRAVADLNDDSLDALLDSKLGKRFSTQDLEQIERALRRYLRERRPRGEPRLLLFLYPGRITRARLRDLREVVVDIDLLIDPCSRSVCRDAMARQIELLGRTIKASTIRGRSYQIRFNSVMLRAKTDLRPNPFETYSFSAAAVIRAGAEHAGAALLHQSLDARRSYPHRMTVVAARNIRSRHVKMVQVPRIVLTADHVDVTVEIKTDRIRYRGDVIAALTGAWQALGTDPLTPRAADLTVTASMRFRRVERRHFRCQGYPLDLYLHGRVSAKDLWSTYVRAEQRGGTRFDFGDETDTAGATASDEPDRTDEILAAGFKYLAPCLQAEAVRNRRFRGVTIEFSIGREGAPSELRTRETTSVPLKACLRRALGRLRFQRQSGAPRQVRYPMLIRR